MAFNGSSHKTPIISEHAIERFRERVPEFKNADYYECCWCIRCMYRHGFKWGGQKGKDFFIRCSHPYYQTYLEKDGYEYVFPCRRNSEGTVVIKSLLTLEQAEDNISTSMRIAGI